MFLTFKSPHQSKKNQHNLTINHKRQLDTIKLQYIQQFSQVCAYTDITNLI